MKASGITKETVLNYGIIDRKFPEFKVGDTIEVSQLVKDGEKERIQLFEGDVIDIHRNGVATTFTVRRIGANGIGVERIFPYYSHYISDIRFIKHGKVRRANLRYLRERIGKSARIQEEILTKEEQSKPEVTAKQETKES
jgi:large subunit ribosomal protein L19